MSDRFHINQATGKTGKCTAGANRCPFGSPSEHHDTEAQAIAFYEKSMATQEVPQSKKAKPMSKDVKRITEARDPIEEARDVIYEKGDTLNEKTARKIFEAAVNTKGDFDGLSEDTKEHIFDKAHRSASEFSGGENWGQTFNEYNQLSNTIKVIRKSRVEPEGYNLGEYGSKVFQANDRLSTLFSIFRTNKDLSDEQGKDALEGAYPVAVSSLDAPTRAKIFEYAQDRGSADGWHAVANEYSDIVDVVNMVKPSRAEQA